MWTKQSESIVENSVAYLGKTSAILDLFTSGHVSQKNVITSKVNKNQPEIVEILILVFVVELGSGKQRRFRRDQRADLHQDGDAEHGRDPEDHLVSDRQWRQGQQ